MDRVTNLILHTNTGTHKVRGTTIRRLFNLPSTTFVLGNRGLARQIIAAATPIETLKDEKSKQKNAIMIASLLDDAADGPAQLMILTASGLKRTLRPEEGWQTIGLYPTGDEAPDSVATLSPARTTPLEQLQLFGRGFGHQVGLCQAGTIEMGKRDWSYRQILAFYYSNVALRSLDY